MTTTAPITFGSTDDSEEIARAELYGLLAQLWLAPPPEDLLRQFGVAVTAAPQPGAWLEAPWQDLVGALRATTAEAAAAEFNALFLGCLLYTSERHAHAPRGRRSCLGRRTQRRK